MRESEREREEEDRGGRVAESMWAVKRLQWVGGQRLGHTATDLCSKRCRPS